MRRQLAKNIWIAERSQYTVVGEMCDGCQMNLFLLCLLTPHQYPPPLYARTHTGMLLWHPLNFSPNSHTECCIHRATAPGPLPGFCALMSSAAPAQPRLRPRVHLCLDLSVHTGDHHTVFAYSFPTT